MDRQGVRFVLFTREPFPESKWRCGRVLEVLKHP